MLCQSKQLGYIHEPLCPTRSPGWITDPVPYWFVYICNDNAETYSDALRNVLQNRYPIAASLRASRSPKNLALQVPEIARSIRYRAKKLTPLLKDPFALFSSEWLADTFSVRPVIMIRKPVAFVSSIKKLNWGFDYEQNWLAQDLLMRDHLADHAESFRGYQGEVDLVGEGIVMWNALYDFVADLERRRPEFSYVRYEDLVSDPLTGYEALYARLGLTWDDDVRARIASYSDSNNPKDVSPRRRRAIKRDSSAAAETWRSRLTPAEVRRVEAATDAVVRRLYGS